MKVRTLPSTAWRYLRDDSPVRAWLEISDLRRTEAGPDLAPGAIALTDANIDELRVALEPIFEARRTACALEANARVEAGRYQRLLDNVTYPTGSRLA